MMQLLHSSPVTAPQFVSLSLLLSEGMAEPLMTVAPIATISNEQAYEAIEELHTHVLRLANVSSTGGHGFSAELLREEERTLKSMQIYRTRRTGLGMYFRVLRGDSTAKLQALVLASSIGSMGKIDAEVAGVLGVILCVGVTGLSTAYGSSPTIYGLPQRMSDCIGYLQQPQRYNDVASAKSLLTTFLLSEDRISNEMAAAPDSLVFAVPDDRTRSGGVLSPMMSPLAEFGRKTARRASVATGLSSQSNGIHQQQEANIIPVVLELSSDEATRTIMERLTVLSVAESDTQLRKYEQSGPERKANLDLTAGSSKGRFRRRKSDARDADLDNFDYKGPAKQFKTKPIPALQPSPELGKLRLSKKDTKKGPTNRRMSIAMRGDDDTSSKNSFDPFTQRKNRRHQFDDEATQDSRSQSGHQDASSTQSQAKIQVSLALNEDLSCSYKLSQLSSCDVEGVLQAQLKCSTRPTNVPFALSLRDPASQIDTLTENRKFADKITLKKKEENYRFQVTLPKQDTYFPILKYKCSGDLRPVPIRVQTKVKSDGGFCRVALQISSNPNNGANLSDLAIMMEVPSDVQGETLATQPTGGVWDATKSSVVWCVSELGIGEKFQLQARFAFKNGSTVTDALSFPVLVRCQCLHVQLSEIDFDATELPDVFQAEVSVKIAKRYRLSHREKNA